MEKLKPSLRFPEFNGDWLTFKLGEIAKFSKGKGLSKSDIAANGIYECIRYGELYTEYGETIFKIKSKTNLLPEDNITSEVNDVIIPASGETQIDIATASCVLKDGVILGGDLNIIKTDNNGVFMSYYLNNSKKEAIASLAQGISVVHLYSSQLATLNINLPSIEEQTKIASFLSAVDDKLNLLKEKKAALEEYKKGMMQKIFSQEIRFKDDNGKDFAEWENAILSEVVELFHGYQFRSSDFTSNGIAVIKIGNVIGNNLDLKNLTFISENRIDEFKHFEIQNDDILMSLTGNIGRIIEVKSKPFTLLQNYRVGKFVPIENEKLLKPFLKYLLASDLVFGRFSQLANQSAQANFGKQDMDKIFVSYPSINEQTKIASFLSAIDAKIDLVSTHIEETQEYKKGLLQQMFC